MERREVGNMHMAAAGLGCRKALVLGNRFSPSFVQMGLQSANLTL